MSGKLGAAIWLGIRETQLVPAATLFAVFFGFGTLANQSTLSFFETLFAAVFIFAGPALIVLADQIGTGASLIATVLAVGATGVRLFPMTLALLPQLRDRDVPKWIEYAIAHFMSVTPWFEAVNRFPHVPKPMRAGYMLGLCLYLTLAGTLGAVVGYAIMGELPRSVSAGFLFLSPIYFMLSMLGGVRKTPGLFPIAAGFLLTPVFHTYAPKMDLLLIGVTGGSLAFWATWIVSNRKARSAVETASELENEVAPKQQRFSTQLWVLSAVFLVTPIARVLWAYTWDHNTQFKDELVYLPAMISVGLALWAIRQSSALKKTTAVSSAPAKSKIIRMDGEQGASFSIMTMGRKRQIPLNIWIISQLPWLALAFPLLAYALGDKISSSRNFYIILAAFAANEVWRMAGAALSSNLSEDSPVIQWARIISTSLISGLIARVILYPPAVLTEVGLTTRTAVFLSGVAVFYIFKRSLVFGVLTTVISLALLQQFLPMIR